MSRTSRGRGHVFFSHPEEKFDFSNDIVLVKGDGGLGYPEKYPYDRICITAACLEIPPPLIEQLRIGGRLIAPVIELGTQYLVLLEKGKQKISQKKICEVLYVTLRGIYGVREN